MLAGVVVALLVVLAILHETAAVAPPLTPAARAHAIGERLACPICHGETVADSPSVLAQQMRGIIADQIAQGRSDAQITQYFVDRYGQGILLAPPAHGFSLLAWLLPIALLVGGGGGIALAAVRWSRRGGADALPALTPEEQAHYGALLAQRLKEAEAAEQDNQTVPGSAGVGAPATEVAATNEQSPPARARTKSPQGDFAEDSRDFSRQAGGADVSPKTGATLAASDAPLATAVAVGLAADRSRRPARPAPADGARPAGAIPSQPPEAESTAC